MNLELASKDDLEEALGRELTEEEEPKGLYYLKLASVYVNTYTKTPFEKVTETIRLKADYYGTVKLKQPVHQVEDVKHHSGSAVWEWHFDGIREIYGLPPSMVVDVTLEYGYDTVPSDVKVITADVAKRLLLSEDDEGATRPLERYRVGDVEEHYVVDESVTKGVFNDIEKMVLDRYRRSIGTWRTGYHQPNPYWNLPASNDDALFE